MCGWNVALQEEGVGFNQRCPAIPHPAWRDSKHPPKAERLLDGGDVEGHGRGWPVAGTQTFADVMVVGMAVVLGMVGMAVTGMTVVMVG